MNIYNIIITVEAKEDDLLGIKESLAMLAEKYGDIICVDVKTLLW